MSGTGNVLRVCWIAFAAAVLLGLGTASLAAADSVPGLSERVTEVAGDAKAKIEEVGTAAGRSLEEMWRRIDEARLKHRSRDEVVAWIIMGLLAGSVVGLFSVFRNTIGQRLGNVLLGLVGALIGGMVVRLARFDLGMGPVLIRYEDLVFSLIGGVLLAVVVKFLIARKQKKV